MTKTVDIISIMNIFDKIKNTSGANDKQAILKKNMNNEDFTKILSFLYNPYIVTGIGKKKMDKFSHHQSFLQQFDNVFDMLDFVTSHNGSVSDNVLKEVAGYINSIATSTEVHQFLRELVTKEYKCGITASTINKVYGKNFIPKHDILLAKSWDDEKHKVKGDFIITKKLDGQRCTVFKENGEVKFYSRKGLPILDMIELEEEFKLLPDNMVYDGELLIVNSEGLNRLELFRATQKRVKKEGIKNDVEFHMYEMLPIDEFRKGKSKLDALQRKQAIYNLLDDHALGRKKGFLKFIKDVPILYCGSDQSILMELLKKELDDGQEGIMVNLVEGKYECKRSGSLLKAKKIEEKTIDLRVIGFEEGTGKYKGSLGRLNVDYKGSVLGVGSGFSDAQRKSIWYQQKELLGAIVEVKYDDFSKNQDGGESLRYPIFVRVRDDKDEVSYHA